jgi:hypothetical protein
MVGGFSEGPGLRIVHYSCLRSPHLRHSRRYYDIYTIPYLWCCRAVLSMAWTIVASTCSHRHCSACHMRAGDQSSGSRSRSESMSARTALCRSVSNCVLKSLAAACSTATFLTLIITVVSTFPALLINARDRQLRSIWESGLWSWSMSRLGDRDPWERGSVELMDST